MSIQWRWTRRAINIPWQDRSRGERREDGESERERERGREKERKEKWTSKREKGRGAEWVRGQAQWTDSFARLLLSFPLYVSTSVALHRTTRPLLRSVIYSQSREDTRCWQLLHRRAPRTHTYNWPICDCSLRMALFIIYQSWFKEKRISYVSVQCGVLQPVRLCVAFREDTVNKQSPLPTSSIIGPKASLSITLWPVDETSAFCTSSSFAAAAFSVNRRVSEKCLEAKEKHRIMHGERERERDTTFFFSHWNWPQVTCWQDF